MQNYPLRGGNGGALIIKAGDGGPGGPGGSIVITGDNGPVFIKAGDGGSIITGESAQSPTTNKGKKTTPHYRDWTQSELDKAIQSEIEKYKDSIENASKGSKGAAKTIKDLFGRNKLADRLLVKRGSRKMISDSLVWQQLAKDANLPRNHQAGKHRPSKKVGFDLAIEQTPTVSIVEAIAKLEEAIAAIKYKDKCTTKKVLDVLNETKSKVVSGEYTPSKGIEIAELCIAQWRDEKTNKVPSKA